jgi:hypothetical protein
MSSTVRTLTARVLAALTASLAIFGLCAAPAQATVYACKGDITTWATGFQVIVTLYNDPAPVDGWTVTWTWDDPNTQVYNSWGAAHYQGGPSVTMVSYPWDTHVDGNDSVTFGFTATGTNTSHGNAISVNGQAPFACHFW